MAIFLVESYTGRGTLRVEEWFLPKFEQQARNRAAELCVQHGNATMQSLTVERNLPYAKPDYVTRIFSLDCWERQSDGTIAHKNPNIF